MNEVKGNLNYVISDTLNPFEEKYRGYFVYLIKGNTNGIKHGLYFGGEYSWEFLSSIDEIPNEPTSNIPFPIHKDVDFTYNGESFEYLPENWNLISPFCDIEGNIQINANTYQVGVRLKYKDWSWVDETNETKYLTFTIKPCPIDSATIILSKDTWSYGDEYPYVKTIMYQDKILMEGVDYKVTYPKEISNYLTITFINNYSGTIKKTYTITKKRIPIPVFSKLSFDYTGETITILPSNWNEISSYCTISNNSHSEIGNYNVSVSLKNTSIYCWDNDAGDTLPIIKVFKIGSIEIPLPIWDNDEVYTIPYDGKEHKVYPLNWEEISDRCSISGNSQVDAGEHLITIRLIGEGLKWEDLGTSDDLTKTFVITKYIVDTPIWSPGSIKYFDGKPFTYNPLNWDDIKEYCNISGNTQTNAGIYYSTVSLKNKINYGWKTSTGVINTNDQKGEFEIKRADGFFVVFPYIHGNFYVGDTVNCIATYVDSTCILTYEWYRNSTATMDGAEFIKATNSNEYKLSHDDVNKFILCNVIAKPTEISNYNGGSSYTVSRVKVAKTIVYDTLHFVDNKTEDSCYYLNSMYQLPDVEGMVEGDQVQFEYSIVSGSDVVDLVSPDSAYLLIKGVGDAVIDVKVKGSKNYIYTPDTLRFLLHVYSNDVIYWGLYDKEQDVTEEDMLYSGLIPSNVQEAVLKENEKGVHAFLFRKQFPFRKFDGEEQNYYGWYVLLPVEKKMIEIAENCSVNLKVDDLQLMTKEDGEPLILISDKNRMYNVYGKFNVAKTSDNWMLHVLFR